MRNDKKKDRPTTKSYNLQSQRDVKENMNEEGSRKVFDNVTILDDGVNDNDDDEKRGKGNWKSYAHLRVDYSRHSIQLKIGSQSQFASDFTLNWY